MKVLVTGGAGFIGSHLVDALIREGHCVRVLDNFDPQVHEGSRPDYLNAKAEYLEGDVRDREALRRALRGIEVVFHEAAAVGVGQSMYAIEHYTSANVLGTSILLDLVVNEKIPLRKLVVASSMSIYGEGLYRGPSGPITPSLRPDEQLEAGQWEMLSAEGAVATPQLTPESKPLMPTSVYAVTKRDQEELCLCVGRSYRIPTVALRYFNVYGPRQALSNPYTGVCAIFSARIKNRNAPLIYEDGLQSRDFVHVNDIVRANLLVMKESRADYRALNVGTGRATTIVDVARTLAKLYRTDIEPALTRKFRSGDIRHCSADISSLRAIGYEPTVALEDGFRKLVEWGQQVQARDRVEQAAKELESRGLTVSQAEASVGEQS